MHALFLKYLKHQPLFLAFFLASLSSNLTVFVHTASHLWHCKSPLGCLGFFHFSGAALSSALTFSCATHADWAEWAVSHKARAAPSRCFTLLEWMREGQEVYLELIESCQTGWKLDCHFVCVSESINVGSQVLKFEKVWMILYVQISLQTWRQHRVVKFSRSLLDLEVA